MSDDSDTGKGLVFSHKGSGARATRSGAQLVKMVSSCITLEPSSAVI